MTQVTLQEQLTRMGYYIQCMRNKARFDLTMLGGTCIMVKNNVKLLGDTVLCAVSTETDDAMYTNNHNLHNELSNRPITSNEYLSGTFFTSLVDLLIFKTQTTNNSKDNYKVAKISLGNLQEEIINIVIDSTTVSACYLHNGEEENISATSYESMHKLLSIVQRMTSIRSFRMITKSNTNLREVYVEGVLSNILKELFIYFNKTIVLEYKQKDNTTKKVYCFDKQFITTEETSRNVNIITSSMNKLPNEYPSNIYLEEIMTKDLLNRLGDNYSAIGKMPLFVRR